MALQSKRDPDFDARWAGGSREAPPTIGRFVTPSRPRRAQRRSLLPWAPTCCSFGDATKRLIMVRRPDGLNVFEFVVLSALRAAQLQRGCTPRVEQSAKTAVTAQREVAEGKVLAVHAAAEPIAPAAG